MTEKDVIDAWARIRKIDNTIPDEVLNFMKDASIRALKEPDSYPLVSLMNVTIEHLEQIANGQRTQVGIEATLLMVKSTFSNWKETGSLYKKLPA